MSFSIAVSGKGGSGKTTAAALIIKALIERGDGAVLAVDADPNSTLAMALGITPPTTISDMREDIMERRIEIPAGVPKERMFEYKFHEMVLENPGFDFLAMGRPEGPKCYCYVNHLLRKYLDQLSQDYAYVLIDNEAGMEHLARRTTDNVDLLVLVSQPTVVGLESVRRISSLASKLPIVVKREALLLNMVKGEGVSPDIAQRAREMGHQDLFPISYDPEVERAWEKGRSLLELPPSNPACVAASAMIRGLLCIGVN